MPDSQSLLVSHLIDTGRWSAAQKLSALLAACAITLDGLDIQILSFAVPGIAADWHMAKSGFALIFACSLFAVAAGTLMGGFIGDRFGRRRAIVLAVLWFGVATLCMATSQSLSMLFFYRMLSGIGIGAALPNATAYVAEVTPARTRTSVLAAAVVCIPLGGVIGGVLAAHVLPVASWRVLIAIAGVMQTGLAGLLAVALPESPRYLATRGGQSARLVNLFRRFGQELPPGASFAGERGNIKEDAGLRLFLSKSYRRDTGSLWAAFCFCLISIYLVFNWLPSMLTTLGMSPASASNGLALYNFGGIVGSVLLGLWINQRGSRIPLLVACAGSIGSALWLALQLHVTPGGSPLLTTQIATNGMFANAVQTTLYALAAHLYPTQFRSRGVAAASAFGRAGAVLSAFLGGYALHLGGRAYFLILAVALTGVAISLQFLRNHLPGGGAQPARARSV